MCHRTRGASFRKRVCRFIGLEVYSWQNIWFEEVWRCCSLPERVGLPAVSSDENCGSTWNVQTRMLYYVCHSNSVSVLPHGEFPWVNTRHLSRVWWSVAPHRAIRIWNKMRKDHAVQFRCPLWFNVGIRKWNCDILGIVSECSDGEARSSVRVVHVKNKLHDTE